MAEKKTAATKAPRKAASKKPAAEAVAAATNTVTRSPIADQVKATGDTIRAEAQRKASELTEQFTSLTAQASDKAKDAAVKGKNKAAEGLESLAKLIGDSSGQVDDKLGKQYGDFARSAAQTVSGLGASLDEKDLDELMAEARDFVKKSPAVAIGSAAVVGFMLARLLRSKS